MTRAPGARPWRTSGRLALALAVSAATSCRSPEKSPSPAATSSARAPAPSASVTTSSVVETSLPAPVPRLESARCRALRVHGDVQFASGEALAAMSPVDGERWIRLGPTAELVLRHSVSARELSLRGPGEMLPCRGGEEQVLIESGALKSAPGTGVRPGAEVWIGTPFGTARYGDAAAEVTVAKAHWKVAVQSGIVWTDPPLAPQGRAAPGGQLASSPAGKRDGRLGSEERATGTGTPNPGALLVACQALAEKAKAAADGVASGGPGLGERAAAQLLLRRRARSACLAAAAAAPRATSAGARARLEDQVRAADRLWEHVPAPNQAQGTVGSGQP
jgi:hypothetical protein